MSCGFWNALCQHLAANAEAYAVGLVAFLISAAKCMPKPGSSLSWLTLYTWIFDSIQAVIPVPRSSVSSNSVPVNSAPVPPTLPETPAPTK